MPLYEVTMIPKSMAKPDLVNAIKRVAVTMLDKGAVIDSMESLGHRDLPFRRNSKLLKEPNYSTNMFLFNTYMPIKTMHDVIEVLKNDKDLLRIFAVSEHDIPKQPEQCTLHEFLKPPAYRKTVQELRENQRLGHFPRMRLFKRVEREWKAIPKSYPIPPPRK
ncbi:unnamed protein product [Bursaphelenchus xylophilus]|uniref:Small ribosomal subunit protein bS6m n=1 Tax=Bursaphelenchus xylophilus TaxID=6326 RepID=A0A1I7SFC7_BURXY|nr:unnamed protein product [Bursaphelenchus xylophilus]CAG9089673.1 unnamed protein product [Bursaphelenchus xylophilus]